MDAGVLTADDDGLGKAEVEVCAEGVGGDDGTDEAVTAPLVVQAGAGATAAVGSNLTQP